MDTSTTMFMDAARWWAFGGAAIGLPPLIRAMICHVRRYVDGERTGITLASERLLAEKAALALLLVGVGIAGFMLPLATRLSYFVEHGPAYLGSLASAWVMMGSGCWSAAMAFSANRWFTAAASLTWSVTVWTAVFATVP